MAASVFGSGFQFLIGKLKTGIRRLCRRLESAFQFLIGKLKTGGEIRDVDLISVVFQFLIGKLKTKWRGEDVDDAARVSIPHRKAKNSRHQVGSTDTEAAFQFLIGKLKTGFV